MDVLLAFALALALTIVVELVVLLLLGERSKWVLGVSVLINCVTNIALNLAVYYADYSKASIIVGEMIVVAVEAAFYYYFLRQKRQAIRYSLLCNAASFCVGLLVFRYLNL